MRSPHPDDHPAGGREQQPDLRLHADDVTALIGNIARSLGTAPDAVDDVVRAAELHDSHPRSL